MSTTLEMLCIFLLVVITDDVRRCRHGASKRSKEDALVGYEAGFTRWKRVGLRGDVGNTSVCSNCV